MNMYLIINEGNHGSIDADDSEYHGYCITRFSSSPYTLQAELDIDVQVIYSSGMLCEQNYSFPININSHYYVSPTNKPNNTIVSLREIINGNLNAICYDSNDIVPSSIRSIPQNYFSSLTPLHVSIEEHNNKMDENN